MYRSPQSGFAPIPTLIVLVVFLAAVGSAYYLGAQQGSQPTAIQNQAPQEASAKPIETTAQPEPESTSSAEVPSLAFKLNPAWNIYTDPAAKFSIQYRPTSKLYTKQEGTHVSFLGCQQDPTHGEICMSDFSVTVYADYHGESRRAWYAKKVDLRNYDVYYEDIRAAGSDVLIITADDPGSTSATAILIPHNNKMYVVSYSSGKASLPYAKQLLATFKFE